MSPKDFRKICHPEPDILRIKVSGDKRRTNRRTNTASPRVDPPGGQRKRYKSPRIDKKYSIFYLIICMYIFLQKFGKNILIYTITPRGASGKMF